MILDKTHLIVFCVGIFLGLCTGFFSGKAIYDRPITESVKRDTLRITDTIPHYYPKPVSVEKVRTEYKWLTRVVAENVAHGKDSVNSASFSAKIPQDSVLVEVPITSKHYQAPEYDAWVSGYEPSLDSIKVYQKTEYITETVTKSKPPNRFSVGLQGGYGYGFKSKTWEPYVGLGIGIRIF